MNGFYNFPDEAENKEDDLKPKEDRVDEVAKDGF